jgi:hypothetical protein
LAKNSAYTGNPVFPLAYGLLDGRDWSPELAQRYYDHMQQFGLRDEGLLGVVRAPFLAALDYDARDHPPRFGTAIGIGPMYLLLLPLFLSYRGMGRLGLWLRLFAVLLFVEWAFTVQHLRYLLPGLVVYGLAVAEGAGRLVDQPPRTPRSAAQLIICAAGFAQFLWFAAVQQERFAPQQALFGLQAREQYLRQRVGYYDAIQYANRTLGSRHRILFVGEWRTFYTEVPFVADAGPSGATIARYVMGTRTVEEAIARLRAGGFTHVLVSWSAWQTLTANFDYLPPDSEAGRRTEQLIGLLPVVYHGGQAVLLRIEAPAQRGGDAGS